MQSQQQYNMGYKVSTNTQDILTSTTIRPGKFGGWLAVNTGTGDAIVDGYTLAPGEGLDYTHIHPDVIWDMPITINLQAAGSKVRLTRLMYKEVARK